jgi:hypothetical protein
MDAYHVQNVNAEGARVPAVGYTPQQITQTNGASSRQVPKSTGRDVHAGSRWGKEPLIHPHKAVTTGTQRDHAPPAAIQIDRSQPAAKALLASTQKDHVPPSKKVVHWATVPKVGGTPLPAIQHHTHRRSQITTVRFTVNFVICGQSYTVHVPPLQSNKAGVQEFEARLIREVASDHKETLRAFLTFNEYWLTFKRPSRTSKVLIPTGEHVLRDAAFKTFLNAVFRDANVQLE